jgi:hypothetical protein
VCGITALLAILGVVDRSALIDAVLFGLIAFGIYKLWRTAAVIGLVLFISEKIFMVAIGFSSPVQSSSALIVALILVVCFVNGVRGTFAFHRLRKD